MEYDFDTLVSNLRSNKYTLIGSGSCRIVYDLDNGYVVKVARDVRGLKQNQAEFDNYQSRKSDFFAEVASISDNSRYLIMVKAEKESNIRTVLKYYNVKSFNELMRYPMFVEDINTKKIGSSDLKRVSNWGIINNIPVLIDYGLNKSIYDKYYRNQRFLRRRFKRFNYTS
jgi:hypothetical protein